MQVKLTIGERLKDLRVERKLTLEQLAAEVGISKSALGKYESDNGKDISPYSILLLADYYGVSCDYLMGRTETKNHPNTALHELHLSDASIDILKTGKFNHRLLSELICHKDFQRFMLDAEIYVDRIADMRVNDMNAVLEAVRQMALMKNGGEENDLHLRTLEVAQIREDEYFGSLIADDLKGILRDIRSEHRPDTMTADEVSFAENMQNQLREAMNFEGSSEEKKAKALLATLGIDYDGHAQLSINSDSYSRADMGFQAVCIGYMLCKKYGVDTQNFAINRIPEKLAGKEPKDIRYELSKTRNAMADIHSRVSDELYKKKQERSKDYER